MVIRNPAYYIIAHASKFVKPGSKRIGSNYLKELPNVAYLTPTGKIVLIVFNDSEGTKTFNIKYNNKTISSALNAGAAGTFVL